MADKGFQGSSCSINSVTIAPLTKVEYSDSPATAPLTGAADSTEKVGTGMHKEKIEIGFIGSAPGVVVGTKGAGSVSLNDGTSPTTNFSTSIVTRMRISGRLGQAITGDLTLRPSA